MSSTRFALAMVLLSTFWLAGCDLLGLEPASAVAARKEAEGKAIGGACRHAGRAIEDCYTLNRKADKAAVFTGWREMNDYMRENKIETVAPEIPTPAMLAARQAEKAAEAAAAEGATDTPAAEPANTAASGKKPSGH